MRSPERIPRTFSGTLPERADPGSCRSERVHLTTGGAALDDRGWWPHRREAWKQDGQPNGWLFFVKRLGTTSGALGRFYKERKKTTIDGHEAREDQQHATPGIPAQAFPLNDRQHKDEEPFGEPHRGIHRGCDRRLGRSGLWCGIERG